MPGVFDLLFDEWVVGLGVPIIVGIGFALLSDEFKEFKAAKTCFVISAVWMYGKTIMWGVTTPENFKVRLLVLALVGAVVTVGLAEVLRLTNHRAASAQNASSVKFAYPWASGNISAAEPGKAVRATRISCYVMDWPMTDEQLQHGRLSMDSLFHFKLDVVRVDAFSTNTRRTFTVFSLDEPEWSSADAPKKLSAWIPLDRETTVYTYRAEARKAHWDGYVILRKAGGNLEREEASSGAVILDSGRTENMAITLFTSWENGNLTARISREYQPLTNDRLRQLGVNEILPQTLPTAKSPQSQ